MNSFKLSLSLLCLTLSLMHAQTNPAPRTLPYSESFNSMLAPTYPTGWGGWSQGTLSGAFQTAAPTGDRVLAGSGTAASITNNVYDFSQKLGFLNSGSTNHGLATALVTTGFASINVGYSIMTIRDNNERTLVVGLQYRVGTSGPFTNISGTSYHNNLTVQVAGNSGVNVQTRSITLPAVCNNQSVVQLRFIAKDSIGAGARPSFAIDNFSASGTSCSGFSISASAQSATTFCQGGSVSLNGAIGLSNSWSNGQTADSITVNQSGLYSLTVTDGNGCTDSTFIQVTANPLPTISVAALGNTTLCQGDSVEIAATGGILYQWNNGFSSANIWASTSGNYSVFGTDQNGCSDSSNAIAISVLNPPVVLQQPSNVQESVGNTATFSVSAQDPNDAFQWQGNTGSGFQNLSNGGQYAGTTTNQLSISNLTLANSGYTFRCQISNVACSTTSQQASLTVVPNSSFANQGSSDLRVFPNPAQDFIAVWQSGKGSSVPYTLSNVQGQILGQGMLNSSSTPLNIGFLPPGSYQISVGGSSIRFIKE